MDWENIRKIGTVIKINPGKEFGDLSGKRKIVLFDRMRMNMEIIEI